jgi:hypothetical protein
MKLKIDRSAFMLLTGAIAGSACYINTGDPNAPAPAGTGTTGTATPATTGTAPQKVISRSALGALAKGRGTATDPNATPTTPTTPATPVTTCYDNAAPAVAADCTLGQTTGCAYPAICNSFKAYFKPKVAAGAAACLAALDAKKTCDTKAAYNCGYAALANTCKDPQVAQLCVLAAPTCKIPQAECEGVASGLNDAGKQKVAYCAGEGGHCSMGIYACIEGLGAPSTEGSGSTKPK